jgi:hypothetical protein
MSSLPDARCDAQATYPSQESDDGAAQPSAVQSPQEPVDSPIRQASDQQPLMDQSNVIRPSAGRSSTDQPSASRQQGDQQPMGQPSAERPSLQQPYEQPMPQLRAVDGQPFMGQPTPMRQFPVQQPLMGQRPVLTDMAVLSLVLGVVSSLLGAIAVFICWIPGIGVASIAGNVLCGVGAFITAYMAFRKIKTGRFSGKRIAVAGVVTGVIGILLSINVGLVYFGITDLEGNILPLQDSKSETVPDDSDRSDDAGESDPDTEEMLEKYKATHGKEFQGSGSFTGVDVTIVSAQTGPNDSAGKPTVIVTYQYKNTDDGDKSFYESIRSEVTQNGEVLKRTHLNGDVAGHQEDSRYAQVKTGDTVTVTEVYRLQDKSPLRVELSSSLDFADQTKVVKTLPLQ